MVLARVVNRHEPFTTDIGWYMSNISYAALFDAGFVEYSGFRTSSHSDYSKYYYKHIGCNVLYFDFDNKLWYLNHMPIQGPCSEYELLSLLRIMSFKYGNFLNFEPSDVSVEQLHQILLSIKGMVDIDSTVSGIDDYVSIIHSIEEINLAYSSQKRELFVLYMIILGLAISSVISLVLVSLV